MKTITTFTAAALALLLPGCTFVKVAAEVPLQFVDWRSSKATLGTPTVSTPESDRAAAQASYDYWTHGKAVTPTERMFWTHCSNCHGDTGRGTTEAPSLRTGQFGHWSEERIANLIRDGRPGEGMPSFSKKGLTETDRIRLARLIKSNFNKGEGK